MAFSLADVVIKKNRSSKDTIAANIKSCHFLVRDHEKLTDNLKYGVWKYVDYRFTKRNSRMLTRCILESMISELLEYCCGKPYDSITKRDAEINESSILYELKQAIYFGATRKLYDAANSVITLDATRFNNTVKPTKLSRWWVFG